MLLNEVSRKKSPTHDQEEKKNKSGQRILTSKLYLRRSAIRDPAEKHGARLLALNRAEPRK